jgi:Helix-turn-helix domain
MTGMMRMGRPMRPIDPADGTIQEFAAELRQLRERAGNPTFRLLARRAHYSPTTLSVACSGTALPSLDVTLAFVRACDGPAEYWQQRWYGTSAKATASPAGRKQPQDSWPSKAAGAIADHPGSSNRNNGTAGSLATAWASRRRQVVAGLIIVASIAGVAFWALSNPLGPAPHSERLLSAGLASPSPYIGVSPCDVGAVVLTQTALRLPAPMTQAGHDYRAGTVIGVVALRFSPRCALAWTRFLPARWLSGNSGGSVTLQSRRPADGATTTLTVSPIVAVEGDPLLTVPGCVLARVSVHMGAGKPAATATTGCYP